MQARCSLLGFSERRRSLADIALRAQDQCDVFWSQQDIPPYLCKLHQIWKYLIFMHPLLHHDHHLRDHQLAWIWEVTKQTEACAHGPSWIHPWSAPCGQCLNCTHTLSVLLLLHKSNYDMCGALNTFMISPCSQCLNCACTPWTYVTYTSWTNMHCDH